MEWTLKEFIDLFPKYKEWEERKRRLYFYLYFDTKQKRLKIVKYFIKKCKQKKISSQSIAQTMARYFFISERTVYYLMRQVR